MQNFSIKIYSIGIFIDDLFDGESFISYKDNLNINCSIDDEYLEKIHKELYNLLNKIKKKKISVTKLINQVIGNLQFYIHICAALALRNQKF